MPKERIPKDWSDCLDPYWKGKMAVDTTPRSFVGLYNAWGESKILEYAARLKNNQPIWVSNQTQAVTQLARLNAVRAASRASECRSATNTSDPCRLMTSGTEPAAAAPMTPPGTTQCA